MLFNSYIDSIYYIFLYQIISPYFRFQNIFGMLKADDITRLSFPVVDGSLAEQKCEIVKLCRELQKQKFIRGDYEELVSLILLYLNGNNEHGFKWFYRPGALHRARWMSKMIYCIKLDLLSEKIFDELPRGKVFASGQHKKIKRFVQFFIFCYVSWWLTAPVPASAPSNDLMLINNLIQYRKIDEVCANAALRAFSRHLWYLTEELVVLGLFSKSVEDKTKEKMAIKLVGLDRKVCSKRIGTSFGKPDLPKIPEETLDDLDLSLFIGEDSWSIFNIMKLNYGFLFTPVKDWPLDDGYCHAKLIVNNLSVVNDGAERGVKLAHDFLDSSKKEDNLQNVLQIVENDRNLIPNQRKRKLSSGRWSLKLD